MKTKALWIILAVAVSALNIFVDGQLESLVLLAVTGACILFYHLARIVELLEERDS